MAGPQSLVTLDGADAINKGLTLWLPGTENGGRIVRDISPYRRPYATVNAPVRVPTRTGRAVALNGSSQNITGASAAPSVAALTISAWVTSYLNTGSRQGIFTASVSGTTPPYNGVLFNLTAAGTALELFPDTSIAVVTSNTFSTSYGEVVHYAVTFDNSTLTARFYRNGVAIGSPVSTNGMQTGLLQNDWGRYGESAGAPWWLSGTLQNMRTWRRALTPTEILRLYRDPWAGAKRTRVASSTSTTYNDTISDSVTAAESNAVTATVRPSLSDAVTAAESNAAAVTANASVSDAATGAEAMAAVATFNAAVSDDTTAADEVTGTVSTVYNETIDDSVTASENMEGDLPNTGDTHDGYLRRSRRERALDAATRRAEEQWRIDRNAVRLALEAAMGMAAEVVEDAPAEAVAAVQEAVREARQVIPAAAVLSQGRISPEIESNASLQAALAKLQQAVEAAARAKALADDDEEVLMLLRAL